MSDEATPLQIKIMPSGPYLVTGGIPLTERYATESVHGEPLAWDPVVTATKAPVQEKYALCRCGQSQNKPFCDGAHAAAGFSAPRREEQQESVVMGALWAPKS